MDEATCSDQKILWKDGSRCPESDLYRADHLLLDGISTIGSPYETFAFTN